MKTSAALVAALLLLSAAPAVAAALTVKFTDTSRLTYSGDWLHVRDHAYTSAHTGGNTRKGTVVCRPSLTGTYQVAASFHATANRGRRARYLVDGGLVKSVDQSQSAWSGAAYPSVPLGVFALTAASTLALEARDGTSYSLVSFSFTPTDQPATGPASDGATDGAAPGAPRRTRTWTVSADGALTLRPYLSTYEPASFLVTVDGKDVLAWNRTNDSARELCVVLGTPRDDSMVEVKPGDCSPAEGLSYQVPVKKGQTVKAAMRGAFQKASFLEVEGPLTAQAGLDDVLAR